MTLDALLSVEQIITAMQATERWPAIVELVDLLVGAGRIRAEHRDAILAQLRAREDSMSTGIGFGIAIPHATTDLVDGVVVAFGRAVDGINFDSLDNAPVQFVVLFLVPSNQFQLHLRTLAAIAKFLNEREISEQLGGAGTREEILRVFRDAGQRQGG